MNRREALKSIASGGALAALSSIAAPSLSSAAEPAGDAAGMPIERNDLQFWLETSLKRVYPNSPAGSARPLALLAARNQKHTGDAERCLDR